MKAIRQLWSDYSEAVVMLAVGAVAFGLLYLCFWGICSALDRDAERERTARLEMAAKVEDAGRAAAENKRRLDEALVAIEELKSATNTAVGSATEAERRETTHKCSCAEASRTRKGTMAR